MIPKIIWQTYKTEYPPAVALDCVRSWLISNPEYEWMYFDDELCDKFMRDHFDDEFYSIYDSLPIGVMKSDMWRVAIVYVYGGFYADLDTRCHGNLNSWVGSEDLLLSVETTHGSICNYFFGAKPKHPALYAALKTFRDCYNSPNYLNKEYVTATPVQNFGAHAFSSGILEYYGASAPDVMAMGGSTNYYNTIDKAIQENTRFLLYGAHEVAPWPDERTRVSHETASMFWREGYDSWRTTQHEQFGV